MKITLQFIADQAHVSRSLVSKVLNGKPVRVCAEKRGRILKLANKYGYEPRGKGAGQDGPVAQIKRRKVIGLIQPGLDFLFLTRLTDAVSLCAGKLDYQVLILNSHEDPKIERRCLDICSSGIVDGLIMNASDNAANLEFCCALRKRGLPMVFVDRYLPGFGGSFVTTDNRGGARELTETLIARGHRNILFVFHGRSIFTSAQMERFDGYQQAMAAHGLESVKKFVCADRSLACQPIFKAYGGRQKFTAVVLATTWDIRKLEKLICELGCSEPVDVAAFDSFSFRYPQPGGRPSGRIRDLLIMEQDPGEMGARAVQTLVDLIENGERPAEHIYLKPRVLHEEAEKAPPGGPGERPLSIGHTAVKIKGGTEP